MPDALILPMVGLATLATIIASPGGDLRRLLALTKQAIQLATPRGCMIHTSEREGPDLRAQRELDAAGAVVALVVSFHSSSAAGVCLRHRGDAHDDDRHPARLRGGAPCGAGAGWRR